MSKVGIIYFMCKELYCKNLTNSLAFHQLNVRFCTTLCVGEIISNYTEKNADELANKILQTRTRVSEGYKKGTLPKECVECIYKNKEDSCHNKIQKLDFYYWFVIQAGILVAMFLITYLAYLFDHFDHYLDKQYIFFLM